MTNAGVSKLDKVKLLNEHLENTFNTSCDDKVVAQKVDKVKSTGIQNSGYKHFCQNDITDTKPPQKTGVSTGGRKSLVSPVQK